MPYVCGLDEMGGSILSKEKLLIVTISYARLLNWQTD